MAITLEQAVEALIRLDIQTGEIVTPEEIEETRNFWKTQTPEEIMEEYLWGVVDPDGDEEAEITHNGLTYKVSAGTGFATLITKG